MVRSQHVAHCAGEFQFSRFPSADERTLADCSLKQQPRRKKRRIQMTVVHRDRTQCRLLVFVQCEIRLCSLFPDVTIRGGRFVIEQDSIYKRWSIKFTKFSAEVVQHDFDY